MLYRIFGMLARILPSQVHPCFSYCGLLTDQSCQQCDIKRVQEAKNVVDELLREFYKVSTDKKELLQHLESMEINVLSPDFLEVSPAPKHIGFPRQYRFKLPSGDIYSAYIGDDCHNEIIKAEVHSLQLLQQVAPKLVPNFPAHYFHGCEYNGPHRPFIIYKLGDLDPEPLSPAFAAKLKEGLAKKLHTYSGDPAVGFGSTRPIFYRGVKIIDKVYPLWKDCFEALITNVLSYLESEKYSKLREQVNKVIKRYVFNMKIEQVHP